MGISSGENAKEEFQKNRTLVEMDISYNINNSSAFTMFELHAQGGNLFQSFCALMIVICISNIANIHTILILLLAFRKLAFIFRLHCLGILTTDNIMTLKTKVLFTVDNEL